MSPKSSRLVFAAIAAFTVNDTLSSQRSCSQSEVEESHAEKSNGSLIESILSVADTEKIEQVGEDEYWAKKARDCSFCKQFLESPCRQPFQHWSRCVDLAKSRDLKFEDACREYTSALFACVGDKQEYFEKLKREREVEGGEGDDAFEDHEDGSDIHVDHLDPSNVSNK